MLFNIGFIHKNCENITVIFFETYYMLKNLHFSDHNTKNLLNSKCKDQNQLIFQFGKSIFSN